MWPAGVILPYLPAVKACHAVDDLHPRVTHAARESFSTHSKEALILPITK